jgi:hypothetical protein
VRAAGGRARALTHDPAQSEGSVQEFVSLSYDPVADANVSRSESESQGFFEVPMDADQLEEDLDDVFLRVHRGSESVHSAHLRDEEDGGDGEEESANTPDAADTLIGHSRAGSVASSAAGLRAAAGAAVSPGRFRGTSATARYAEPAPGSEGPAAPQTTTVRVTRKKTEVKRSATTLSMPAAPDGAPVPRRAIQPRVTANWDLIENVAIASDSKHFGSAAAQNVLVDDSTFWASLFNSRLRGNAWIVFDLKRKVQLAAVGLRSRALSNGVRNALLMYSESKDGPWTAAMQMEAPKSDALQVRVAAQFCRGAYVSRLLPAHPVHTPHRSSAAPRSRTSPRSTGASFSARTTARCGPTSADSSWSLCASGPCASWTSAPAPAARASTRRRRPPPGRPRSLRRHPWRCRCWGCHRTPQNASEGRQPSQRLTCA